MSSSAIGDVLRVVALMDAQYGGQIANVYHVKLTTVVGDPPTDAETKVDMAQYMDDMYATVDQDMAQNVAFDTVNVFNVTQNRPLGNQAWPTLTNGASSGDPLAPQTALFLQGNTGYSRNWARKFLGTFSETRNDGNASPDSTLLTAAAAFAVQWLAGYLNASGDEYTPVVFHTKSQLWRTVLEVIIRDVWSTIRRRRIGRGA